VTAEVNVKIKELFGTKRSIAAVVGTAALVAVGTGIAFASYSGTSNIASGTTHDAALDALVVTSTGCTGTIFPGYSTTVTGTTATCTFTIANHTPKHGQTIIAETATVDTTSTGGSATYGDIITNATHTPVSGCKATYFTVTPTPSVVGLHINHTPASGNPATAKVKVGLESGPTENACQGKYPTLTFKVKSAA
jgi:hypothetical protein